MHQNGNYCNTASLVSILVGSIFKGFQFYFPLAINMPSWPLATKILRNTHSLLPNKCLVERPSLSQIFVKKLVKIIILAWRQPKRQHSLNLSKKGSFSTVTVMFSAQMLSEPIQSVHISFTCNFIDPPPIITFKCISAFIYANNWERSPFKKLGGKYLIETCLGLSIFGYFSIITVKWARNFLGDARLNEI